MFAKVVILRVNVRSLTANYYTRKFVVSLEVVIACYGTKVLLLWIRSKNLPEEASCMIFLYYLLPPCSGFKNELIVYLQLYTDKICCKYSYAVITLCCDFNELDKHGVPPSHGAGVAFFVSLPLQIRFFHFLKYRTTPKPKFYGSGSDPKTSQKKYVAGFFVLFITSL